jgi:hypothetical protein
MQHIQPHTTKGPVDWFTGDVFPTIVLTAMTHRGSEWAPSTSHPVHERLGTRTPWASTFTSSRERRWFRSGAKRSSRSNQDNRSIQAPALSIGTGQVQTASWSTWRSGKLLRRAPVSTKQRGVTTSPMRNTGSRLPSLGRRSEHRKDAKSGLANREASGLVHQLWSIADGLSLR